MRKTRYLVLTAFGVASIMTVTAASSRHQHNNCPPCPVCPGRTDMGSVHSADNQAQMDIHGEKAAIAVVSDLPQRDCPPCPACPGKTDAKSVQMVDKPAKPEALVEETESGRVSCGDAGCSR